MIWRYHHPEYFTVFDRINFDDIHNIVLYGAGRVGGMAAHCLEKRGIRIAAVCDSAVDKHGTVFCGINVISPSELQEKYPDATVIVSSVFHVSIRETLSRLGFKAICDCAFLFEEIDFAGYDFWMEPKYAIRMVEQYLSSLYARKQCGNMIDALYLNVTTRCTLRCKECSSFVPYITAHKKFSPIEIMQWFEAALNVLGTVRVLNFYGGEPLLFPQLSDMLDMLAGEKRIKQIQVTTNATILPGSGLLRAMKRIEAHVRISKYSVDVGQRVTSFANLLQNEGIAHEIVNFTYWDAGAKITKKCDLEQQALRQRFIDCTSCRIMYLFDGKAFLCSPACYYHAINDSSEFNKDYADLTGNPESVARNIMALTERLHNGDYFRLCRYCNGVHATHFEHKIPVAEQATGLLVFPELS